MHPEVLAIQKGMDSLREENIPIGDLSDGYHTYNDLYKVRGSLYIALAKRMAAKVGGPLVWVSKVQSDGTAEPDGWFLLGIDHRAGKQITFHMPIADWDICRKFAHQRAKAPEYDGHTSDDVMKRIADL